MHLKAKDVIARAEKAEARKDLWREIYEDCYEFALPQRNLYDGYYEGRSVAAKKMERVYDSTAVHSPQRFANRIQSTLFPPYRTWCRLTPGNDIAEDQQSDLQIALDLYSEKMFAVLRQSNFDLAMSEFLLDLCVGTGILLVQPGDADRPVRFEAVPQFLVSLEEGAHGKVDNVYRRLRIKAEAIEQQWPDAKLSSDLKKLIEDKPTEEVELLEATVYMPEGDYFCYHLIHREKQHEIVYRETTSSPWIVARYMKVAGEVYGRGPLVSALPDIKTINATKRLLLQNASLAISGVYTAADDGVLNPQTVRIQPGSIIPVARNGGPQGESLRPLQRGGDFNVAQLVINDLQVAIKRMLLDDTLPPDNMSARSALEVSARMSELAQNMGAAFGRLITEAMLPIVSRILFVMDQQNLIDMPLRINGQEVKIVPVSPLARAQNSEELQAVMQYMQLAAQMGPAGAMALNQERTLDFVADRLGIPASILNSAEEREMMAAQMQQMAEQAMAQEGEGGEEPSVAA